MYKIINFPEIYTQNPPKERTNYLEYTTPQSVLARVSCWAGSQEQKRTKNELKIQKRGTNYTFTRRQCRTASVADRMVPIARLTGTDAWRRSEPKAFPSHSNVIG